jgi:hypothetical protein
MREGNHIFLKNRSGIFFARGLDKNSASAPDGQITLRYRVKKRQQRSAFHSDSSPDERSDIRES